MQAHWRDELSDLQVAALHSDIVRNGYARVDGFITEDELQPLNKIADRAVDQAGGYASFVGASDFEGTVWQQLPHELGFQNTCRRLAEKAVGKLVDVSSGYQVFRCLKGESAQPHSMYFHYDSFALTVLLPISIPLVGARGNLLIFPSRRPIRRTYLANLFDKLIADSKPAQRRFRRLAYENSTRAVSIPMLPGCAYFFWGYRSLHTNEACDLNKLRATALIHYGDPHVASRLRRALKRLPH